MATFTAIKNRGGGSGALGGVLHYVQQEEKTTWEDRRLVSGWNCTAQSVYDEMRLTKEQFDKTDGRQYYHFVQSFDKQDDLSPQEVHTILMERIRDKTNAERYDRMIQKREAEIAAAQKQIEELQNIEETLRSRQAKLKRDISMMDDILKEGHLSEAHLRLLVDKIYVHEEDGKLSLDICLKAPFRDHLDIYENGEQTECWIPHSYGFELLDDVIPNNLHENE